VKIAGAKGGAITLFGRDITHDSPGERRALGLYFVPEERLGRAAVPTLSLAEKHAAHAGRGRRPGGLLRPGNLRQLALRLIERFPGEGRGPDSSARSLSGGNLQKFVVGRDVDAKPAVLIVAQPTWGCGRGGRRTDSGASSSSCATKARRCSS